MRYEKKMNRYERSNYLRAKLEKDLSGEGLYVYRNNTPGDLSLPKPDAKGSRLPIKPGGQFEGDNYFMGMVRSNELKLVREISPPRDKGELMKESHDKLILDQPPTVTGDGAVEHVAPQGGYYAGPDKKLPLAPVNEQPGPSDRLIVEDPFDGVEIITD
jgi:hypothetical protein